MPRTVYPRRSNSLTSHEAMKPPAPVTHTVLPAIAALDWLVLSLGMQGRSWGAEEFTVLSMKEFPGRKKLERLEGLG